MAKFLTKAGLVIETEDAEKIEVYKAKGLTEFKTEPQPEQKEVIVTDDFIVKKAPVKTKKGSKKGG